jgi:hypothetical protein
MVYGCLLDVFKTEGRRLKNTIVSGAMAESGNGGRFRRNMLPSFLGLSGEWAT